MDYNLQFQLFENITNYFASVIEYDVLDNAPNTFDELMQYYNDTGRIGVWSGASDATIFNNPASNHAFRAWHDMQHILRLAPFTLEGEALAMQGQMRMVERLGFISQNSKNICFQLLRIEIMEQAKYAAKHGEYMTNQKEFVINKLRGF